MTTPIDFYFDFTSPYGYLASTKIEALASAYQRSVNWHPLLLGVVFKATGSKPLTEIPLKGAYSLHDIQRSACFHQIDYRHPDNFPIATAKAARALLWLQTTHTSAQTSAFLHAVFRAYFVDGLNIGEASVIEQIAITQGLDGAALLAGADSDAIRAQAKIEIEQAIEVGVFGSPFIVVDEEPFWGFDRFDQIQALLKNGAI